MMKYVFRRTSWRIAAVESTMEPDYCADVFSSAVAMANYVISNYYVARQGEFLALAREADLSGSAFGDAHIFILVCYER